MLEPDQMPPPAPPRLSSGALLARFATIGLVMLAGASAFAYAGGWLTPQGVTREKFLAALQGHDKAFPGFRRNHSKGLCLMGRFDSNGQASALSSATLFKPSSTKVIGRFALAGYLPFQQDKPGSVRSMALRFLPADGAEWRTGMNNIPVFVANSTQGFYDLMLASAPNPATGKPDPAKMGAFAAAHPETLKALGILHDNKISSGFGNSTYWGLDAFRFVNQAGASVPVRWSVVPVQADEPAPAGDSPNVLFDDAISQVHAHPLQWHLMITVAQPGDPTSDATLPWPADRRQIDAGTITIDQVASEDDGPCRDVNYDPMVLPPGITAGDDPIPSARSAAYALSYTRRAGELDRKAPSAVTPQEAHAGDKS